MGKNRGTLGTLAVLLMLLIGAVLFIWTAYRSQNILGATLANDAKALAYIGIAGLDGGLIMWFLFFGWAARGDVQKGIALLMIIVSFAGVALTSYGDSLLNSMPRERVPQYIETAVWYGTPAIILANVAAIIAAHLADPERLRHDKERVIEDADHDLQLAIMEETARQLRLNQAQMARQIAPVVAQRYMDNLAAGMGRYGAVEAPKVQVHDPGGDTTLAEQLRAWLGQIGSRRVAVPVQGPDHPVDMTVPVRGKNGKRAAEAGAADPNA